MRLFMVLFTAVVFAVGGNACVMAQLQPGNLVVTVDGQAKEYNIDGTLVQTIEVPQDEGADAGPRDLVVDADGKMLVYNGTFLPSLSIWDPVADSWTHRQFEGWATVANIAYGGIGVYGDKVYLTDMLFNYEGRLGGIITFDRETETRGLVDAGGQPIDLCVGLDGFLYSIYAPSRIIEVFNPIDGCLVRRIFVEGDFDFRAIAVDRDSNIYLVTRNGVVRKLDAAGNFVHLAYLGSRVSHNLIDIDVDGYGNVAIGTADGEVIVLNSFLSFVSSFETGHGACFVAFTDTNPLSGKRNFFGTPDDDVVVFDQDMRQITINGNVCNLPEGVDVNFFGGLGSDSVTFLDRPGDIDFAVLEDQTMKVNCPDCDFFAFESEQLEFVGSDSMDLALINDTAGVDQLMANIYQTVLTTEMATLTASRVANVYVFSRNGADQATYRGSRFPESLRCNLDLKRVRVTGRNSFVMMQGFDTFFSNAGQASGDHAIVLDSPATEYLYSREDYTRVMNAQFDYAFRGYDVLNVWSEGSGFDRARFQATEGSQFFDNGVRAQQTGPGFRTSVFGFDDIELIDP